MAVTIMGLFRSAGAAMRTDAGVLAWCFSAAAPQKACSSCRATRSGAPLITFACPALIAISGGRDLAGRGWAGALPRVLTPEPRRAPLMTAA